MINNLLLSGFGRVNDFMMAGSGWNGFKSGLDGFFKDGLGGPGAKGIGMAIMVLGIVAAVISFAMHHFNPQSRMPSWIICLLIGFAGGILMLGVEKPVSWFKSGAQWVESLLGV